MLLTSTIGLLALASSIPIVTSALPLDVSEHASLAENSYTDTTATANRTGVQLERRWFSFKSEDEVKAEGRGQYAQTRRRGTWPAKAYPAGHPYYLSGPPQHHVPYCFSAKDDAAELAEFMAYALAMWWPAFRVSSVMIFPDPESIDPASSGSHRTLLLECVCGKQPHETSTSPDTLRIAFRPFTESGSDSTGGFSSDHNTPGRHDVRLRNYIPPGENLSEEERVYLWHKTAWALTHELGHALGLLHEHERSDRDHFLNIDCTGLLDYEAAESEALDPRNAGDWTNVPTLKERMERICFDREMSKKYLGTAGLFIKRDDAARHDPNGFVYDKRWFDYGSIMIYGSLYGASSADRWPLSKRFPEGYVAQLPGVRADGSRYSYDSLYFLGGAVRASDVAVSVMDIKRVAQLYPGTQEQIKDALNLQPDGRWKEIATKDMIDSPAWGSQNHAVTGDRVISSVLPDVVNRALQPTVFPNRRWARLYDWYCKDMTSLLECTRQGLDQALIEAEPEAAVESRKGAMSTSGQAARPQDPEPPDVDGVNFKKRPKGPVVGFSTGTGTRSE